MVGGIRFASQREARRYQELKLLEQAGQIRDLKPHPRYELWVNDVKIGTYTGDSRYVENEELVVEDVKSKITRTEAYGLRRRLMLALYGIQIREVF